MTLSEIIIEKIRKEGPISFRDFMEMSLYYPGLGYYTSSEDKIGKSGDYYTSPYFTHIFGEIIGRQLEEIWSALYGLDKKEFTIVEYGAGMGSLCHDILNYLKNQTELYKKLHYYIIEKSAVMQEKEKMILNEKVSWFDSIHDIPKITGCILSNEVVDNFSVHQVVMEEELMEVFVDYKNGFVETLKPASAVLKDYMNHLNVVLPKGFRTEINLQAIDWIKEIANALEKGFVITIDYGYPSSELYSMRRNSGTLLCYNKHNINDCPYSNIGKQDITAHVNFSALYYWGLKYGLEYCGFTTQAYFLLALGLADHLRKMEESGKYDHINDKEKAFFIRTLLMDMGSKLKVLVQQKGIRQPELSGLKFSQQLH